MSIWILLVVYQIKHFIADYPLQGKYMMGKFRDVGWAKPLLAHALVHGFGTAIICIIAGKHELAIPVALFDTVVHFIMDRIKASNNMLGRFKALSAAEYQRIASMKPAGGDFSQAQKRQMKGNTYFWWSLGFDQMVHHLSDLTCAYWIFTQ